MSKERQLSAIMFTDIVGYTALMQRDEKSAIELRERHRITFETETANHHGKIVQYFGDGTLSIFKSTVEAVDCAIAIQQEFQKDPKIPLRIGIHVGDIVHSKDDIIGDAVNVASRIESCAVGGSILISDKVNDQIRGHRHIESKFLDAYELKNVDETIPIFAIANEGLVVPKPEDVKGKLKNLKEKKQSKSKIKIWMVAAFVALSLFALNYFGDFTISVDSSEKSIAVLPFDNLSTDEDAEIFRDGVTEDILTQLSKIKDLRVISRTSVMQYKNTTKTIPEIAKELGVTFILEGSIRKYGDDVRVTAQLINARSDEHLWAENYDKKLTNIFAIQSEVSQEIADELELNLTTAERRSIAAIPEYNIEAYKLFLQGRQEADKRNEESLKKSIAFYQQALAIDSNYAEAYAEIANSTYLLTYYGSVDHISAGEKAREYLEKAERLNPNISRIYSVRGLIYNIEGKRDLAKAEFEKALELSPNDITARHQFATFHYYSKEYEKQLEQAEIAYRMDPLSFPTANSYFTALVTNQKYQEAEKLMMKIEEEGLEKNPVIIHRSFFRLYMDMRNYEKAIYHAEKIVDQHPIFNRYLGYCYAKVGEIEKARERLKIGMQREKDRYWSHEMAVIYAGLQNKDSAIYYLDTIRNKAPDLIMMDRGTFLTTLEGDPRYHEKLREHGIE